MFQLIKLTNAQSHPRERERESGGWMEGERGGARYFTEMQSREIPNSGFFTEQWTLNTTQMKTQMQEIYLHYQFHVTEA